MKRVLFVDDDQNVLAGLRRLLRRDRHSIEAVMAESGAAALELLNSGNFDIVVSDMKMPVMDGAELLAKVQAQQPAAVRIILSGHAELEATMRAVPVAHQFLSKPCEGDDLKRVLNRALELSDLLGNEDLRRAVGGIDSLPSLPQVYQELSATLEDPDAEIDDVAAVLLKDAALSAKILQIVNSSFFGLLRRVTNVREAVSYLGTSMVKNLVLFGTVFKAFDHCPALDEKRMAAEQDHSLLTARVCQEMFDEPRLRDDAFTAGLLHDLGRLILIACEPAAAEHDHPEASENHDLDCENQYGTNHAAIGAYLLGLWGMPGVVVDAIARHHGPIPEEGPFSLAEALHIADVLARRVHSTEDIPILLAEERILALGLSNKIDEWVAMAREFVLEKVQ